MTDTAEERPATISAAHALGRGATRIPPADVAHVRRAKTRTSSAMPESTVGSAGSPSSRDGSSPPRSRRQSPPVTPTSASGRTPTAFTAGRGEAAHGSLWNCASGRRRLWHEHPSRPAHGTHPGSDTIDTEPEVASASRA